jgi:hypothetical protein
MRWAGFNVAPLVLVGIVLLCWALLDAVKFECFIDSLSWR